MINYRVPWSFESGDSTHSIASSSVNVIVIGIWWIRSIPMYLCSIMLQSSNSLISVYLLGILVCWLYILILAWWDFLLARIVLFYVFLSLISFRKSCIACMCLSVLVWVFYFLFQLLVFFVLTCVFTVVSSLVVSSDSNCTSCSHHGCCLLCFYSLVIFRSPRVVFYFLFIYLFFQTCPG